MKYKKAEKILVQNQKVALQTQEQLDTCTYLMTCCDTVHYSEGMRIRAGAGRLPGTQNKWRPWLVFHDAHPSYCMKKVFLNKSFDTYKLAKLVAEYEKNVLIINRLVL